MRDVSAKMAMLASFWEALAEFWELLWSILVDALDFKNIEKLFKNKAFWKFWGGGILAV